MARQRNQAVFVFFVIMVLFAVSFVFSFPRENRYGLIPRRVLTRERFPERFPWKLKRMPDEDCKDKRPNCKDVILDDKPSYWCDEYKGQCDEYCGECAAACQDIESVFHCHRARIFGRCRERKWKDGCELTCCNCDKKFRYMS
ncbi:unnamed protein product [Porites evermanni]|uniref:Uncharacterized protein n=1 Tax=Porites evermanni TaxID=104178 RepID=A0ABN8M0F4_9CNID|nr:unnamed protein product [Porites evermanni]